MRIDLAAGIVALQGALCLSSLGCQRATGYCQTDTDCASGLHCSAETSTCQLASGGGDLALAASDLAMTAPHLGTRLTTPPGSAAGDGFGYSIATTNSFAVFGSPSKNLSTGWASTSDLAGTSYGTPIALAAPLAPDVQTAGDSVGISVSASGTSVAVGAYGKDGLKGAAYVYLRNGAIWTQQVKAVASDPMVPDYFGGSVSLSGDTLAVGAANKNGGMGAAYVFMRTGTTWSAATKLLPPDGAQLAYDYFGAQVAATATEVAVSAPGRMGGKGAVYLYKYDTTRLIWSAASLAAVFTGLNAGDQAGQALQLTTSFLAIGAPSASPNGLPNQGAVYIQSLAGAAPQVTLVSQQPQARERFGAALSLVPASGTVADTLVVGAPGRQQAFVYRVTPSLQWSQHDVLDVPPDGRNAAFGSAVATTGTEHLVGIRGYASDIGSVYSYLSP